MKPFDPARIRGHFPALNQAINGRAPVFLDGPGGTQVPQCVLDAMNNYLGLSNSNLLKSPFFAVEETHKTVRRARESAAAFVNAPSPDEIVFGANMSTITAHFSRSISRDWKAGDEIILTALEHYANVSYWKMAAADRGVKVHVIPLRVDDCALDYDYLEKILSPKVKFIALGLASNVCGSLSQPQRVIKAARSVGALVYIDAVHYAPHYLPDVQALDCDFLVCSAYKFFGPHLGFLYAKRAHLERMTAYKVEVAPDIPPEKWETGTKNFEALAGFIASIEYLAGLGEGASLRARLQSAYQGVAAYEQEWSREFLKRAYNFKGMKVYGITDLARVHERTSTFALNIEGRAPQDVSDKLARVNISAGAGGFYGVGVTDALGLTDKGGVLRVGCVHYNTIEEMDRLFEAL